MKILCKKGVRFDVLRDKVWNKMDAICMAFKEAGYECVITCGTEDHGPGDPHTNGYARDFRTWHIKTEKEKIAIVAKIQEYTGSDYYTKYEPTVKDNNGKIIRGEHIHWQVKKSLWPYLMDHDI